MIFPAIVLAARLPRSKTTHAYHYRCRYCGTSCQCPRYTDWLERKQQELTLRYAHDVREKPLGPWYVPDGFLKDLEQERKRPPVSLTSYYTRWSVLPWYRLAEDELGEVEVCEVEGIRVEAARVCRGSIGRHLGQPPPLRTRTSTDSEETKTDVGLALQSPSLEEYQTSLAWYPRMPSQAFDIKVEASIRSSVVVVPRMWEQNEAVQQSSALRSGSWYD